MKVNKTSLVVIAIVAAAAVVGAILVIRSATVREPNPKVASPRELNVYLASDAFGSLDDDRKMAYLDRVRKESPFPPAPPQGLTPQQQANLFKNMGVVFRKMMDKQVDDFLALPAQKRNAYLDQIIDRMEGMRKAGAKMFGGGSGGAKARGGPPAAGPRPGGPGKGFGPPPPSAVRGMIDSIDPKRRARMAQFWEAMQIRMKARGIKGP
jgi:hypothetical protein